MAPTIALRRWRGIAASLHFGFRLAGSTGLLLTTMLRNRLGAMLAE
ncbi:MAG TPA: hypothetical protein VFP01_03640 [Propionibacteriaceae bacterium]|nr:hypothetical protein [Propionibacteriaceae bacterium]